MVVSRSALEDALLGELIQDGPNSYSRDGQLPATELSRDRD